MGSWGLRSNSVLKKGYLTSLDFIRQSSARIRKILLKSPHVWHKRLISRLKREYFQPTQSKLLVVIASTDMLGKNTNKHSKNSVRRMKKEYRHSQDKTCIRKRSWCYARQDFLCVVSDTVCFCKSWRKLPEDGRGSKWRKGHRDNIISYQAKTPINFEENNGKVFKHYKARDKKLEGQKTNKRGINHKNIV